jgi:upstream-binding transcription factor
MAKTSKTSTKSTKVDKNEVKETKKVSKTVKDTKKDTKAPAEKKPKVSKVVAVINCVINLLTPHVEEDELDAIKNALTEGNDELSAVIGKSASTGLKRQKDPLAPKRGKSSYIFFCVDNREKIKKANPDFEAKELIRELGRVWREETSDKEKEKYAKQSAADKERYADEIKDYEPPADLGFVTPRSKGAKKTRKAGPKRGLTSYIFFCKDMRPKLKEESPDMATKDVTAELGKRWRELSENKKKPFEKLAAEDKARYESEKESWVDPSGDEDEAEKPAPAKKGAKADKKAPAKSAKGSKKVTAVDDDKEVATQEKPKKAAKTDKKATKVEDTKASKPKKGGGLAAFIKEERSSVKEENPDWTAAQVTKELNKLWNDLSSEEQDEYNTKAAEESA